MSAAPKTHPPLHRYAARTPGAAWRPGHNQWAIALVVTIATFMEVLDTSIANVALPHIAGGLSASEDESTWILTSYLVANAIVLPLSAWVSSQFGRKRFYMACVALFTLSSMMCGIAHSLAALIFFRVLQGAGGGGLGPSEQGILADTFPSEQRGMAFAVYGMAVILAPAVGPTLGGWITDHFSWRWIFFINVPAGLLSLLLTWHMIEDPPYLRRAREQRSRAGVRIDYMGILLVGLFLGPLQVMLDRGEENNWFQSHSIVTLATVCTASLVALLIWESNTRRPVVDLKLFRNRTYAIANLLMFVLGVVVYGGIVLLPQYLQVVMGYSSELAGMALSPGGFTLMLMMPLVGWMVSQVDARWLILLGFGGSALATYHMTTLDVQMDFHSAMMLRVYTGSALAFLFVPINTLAYTGIAPDKNDDVSSMVNLARNIGGSVGIALLSAAVTERAQLHQDHLALRVTSYDRGVSIITDRLSRHLSGAGLGPLNAQTQSYARLYHGLQAQAATMAYNDAFYILAVLCVLMLPLIFLMKGNDPSKGMVLG